jgi:hypothetical protein
MNDEQKVGYKRPPVHSQFEPGVSGNPGGRPKRRPRFRRLLMDELAAADPNSETSASKLQAIIRSIIAAAIEGNGRAQALLLAAVVRIDDGDDGDETLSPEDRELLDAHFSGKSERRE